NRCGELNGNTPDPTAAGTRPFSDAPARSAGRGEIPSAHSPRFRRWRGPVPDPKRRTMSLQFEQNPACEATRLQDEIILFHPKLNKFCLFNQTLAFIWSQLERPATAEQLAEELSRGFQGVTVQEASRDVDSILKEMVSLGLVVSLE